LKLPNYLSAIFFLLPFISVMSIFLPQVLPQLLISNQLLPNHSYNKIKGQLLLSSNRPLYSSLFSKQSLSMLVVAQIT